MRDRPGNVSASVLDILLDGTGPDQLVVCPLLLAEVDDVLRRPKIRRYVAADEVAPILMAIVAAASMISDPSPPVPRHTADPDSDYLVAVALRDELLIVSGDSGVLRPWGQAPAYRVMSPRDYWDSCQVETG